MAKKTKKGKKAAHAQQLKSLQAQLDEALVSLHAVRAFKESVLEFLGINEKFDALSEEVHEKINDIRSDIEDDIGNMVQDAVEEAVSNLTIST